MPVLQKKSTGSEAEDTMSLTIVRCIHCSHEIANRTGIAPRQCSRCHKHPLQTTNRTKQYDIDDLVIGGSKLFPWINTADGYARDTAKIVSRNRSLVAAAKRRGWTIRLWPTAQGVEVQRIA